MYEDGTGIVASADGANCEDIVIPEKIEYDGKSYTITEIGNDCGFDVAFEGEQRWIQTIQLPDTITAIGSSSFARCTNLKSINIPKNLKKIGSLAFYGCSKLEYIELPEGIERIGGRVFLDCNSLVGEIIIPKSVVSFQAAFQGCYGLAKLSVEEGNTAYCSDEEGNIYNIEKTELIQGSPIASSVVIPDTVTEIGDYAFYQAEKLKTITLSKK